MADVMSVKMCVYCVVHWWKLTNCFDAVKSEFVKNIVKWTTNK
jgi:hypothetical protein